MKTVYLTLTGTNHYYGVKMLEKGMEVFLEKDPTNDVDKEAIKVRLPGLGKIGYVANSCYSVFEECMSAGRLYDKIGATTTGKIVYVTDRHAVISVDVRDDV